MDNIKCLNCGQENQNTNLRCIYCNAELKPIEQSSNFLNVDYSQENAKAIQSNTKKAGHIANIILVIVLIPWFLIGIAFVGISSYSMMNDNGKSKGYLETEGKLVDYVDCQYDEDGAELCNGLYEYTVDGTTYKGSPNLLSDRSGFKSTITVKYNPNNPSEYVMNSGWNTLLIAGIIILIVALVIFISVKKALKNMAKKINETVKYNQVANT